MHLNGWQRIGVVASICWFVVGGLWINGLVIDGLGAPARYEFNRCLVARSIQPDGTVPKDTDWGPCEERFSAAFVAATADHWFYAAAYALIPIPIVWLLVYGLVALFRWIRAGFARRQIKLGHGHQAPARHSDDAGQPSISIRVFAVNSNLGWLVLGLLLLAWWDGFLSNTSTFHVLELKCVSDTGFDDDQRCLKFERPGAELEITVNTNTQKVLISVVKNDGGWIVKDYLLDHCSVITADTWKCEWSSEGGSPEFRYLTEYGMMHGRYYKSLTGGGSFEFLYV